MEEVHITVGTDSPYKTIQRALDSIEVKDEVHYVITIGKGVYREKVMVMIPRITLRGDNPEDTVITYDDCASKILPDGRKMGTFNSFTLYIGAADFKGENLSIVNSAGPGSVVGQAVALYGDADRIHLKNCRLSAYQDTLCTGPLPIDPVPKGINPLHSYHMNDGDKPKVFRQYYENCYIEGDIDFIFGSARAVFRDCEIHSRYLDGERTSFITAPSHIESEKTGYIFLDCRLTGKAAKGSVFLGRPWRSYGSVSFINCEMGEHIHCEGWDNWSSREKERTSSYSEFHCYGAGSNRKSRVKWANISDSVPEGDYSLEKIFTS